MHYPKKNLTILFLCIVTIVRIRDVENYHTQKPIKKAFISSYFGRYAEIQAWLIAADSIARLTVIYATVCIYRVPRQIAIQNAQPHEK